MEIFDQKAAVLSPPAARARLVGRLAVSSLHENDISRHSSLLSTHESPKKYVLTTKTVASTIHFSLVSMQQMTTIAI